MNAFLLVLPLLLIRFGLLGMQGKSALSRAALFAPLEGGEKAAYYVYQLSNVFIMLFPLFLKVQTSSPLFIAGLFFYVLGMVVLVSSTLAFAKPNQSGLNVNSIYKLSRNPMYIGYFIYFVGCALLMHSIILFIAVFIFQLSAHWIILSEERWCRSKFGSQYTHYMKRVRRYL